MKEMRAKYKNNKDLTAERDQYKAERDEAENALKALRRVSTTDGWIDHMLKNFPALFARIREADKEGRHE